MHVTPEPRNVDFHMDADIPKFWLDGHCHRTRFFDALSIMFPEGERAFIESVAHYRARFHDDSPLARDVAAFVAQEALHTREHVRYNRRLTAQGTRIDALEKRVAAQQAFARRHLPPSMRLALTICLEHFTAMIAGEVLRDARTLAGAEPRMEALWRWHAYEEIEHKAVAFDVFATVVPGALRRYALRCFAMLIVTLIFTALSWRITLSLIRQDGRALDMRGWRELLGQLFVKPGLLRRVVPQWLAWFAPSFHPWRHDDRALLGAMACVAHADDASFEAPPDAGA